MFVLVLVTHSQSREDQPSQDGQSSATPVKEGSDTRNIPTTSGGRGAMLDEVIDSLNGEELEHLARRLLGILPRSGPRAMDQVCIFPRLNRLACHFYVEEYWNLK